jgi:hypothetical protein
MGIFQFGNHAITEATTKSHPQVGKRWTGPNPLMQDISPPSLKNLLDLLNDHQATVALSVLFGYVVMSPVSADI